MEDIKLGFSDGALKAIAEKAVERKTGARGLRSIMENILLDTMYDLPSSEDIIKVVIDENVINNGAEPLLIYESSEMQKVATD